MITTADILKYDDVPDGEWKKYLDIAEKTARKHVGSIYYELDDFMKNGNEYTINGIKYDFDNYKKILVYFVMYYYSKYSNTTNTYLGVVDKNNTDQAKIKTKSDYYLQMAFLCVSNFEKYLKIKNIDTKKSLKYKIVCK